MPKQSLRENLFEEIDSRVLTIMRIVTGVAIAFWAWSYLKTVHYGGEVVPVYEVIFLQPDFLFKYAGFEWVKLWPGNGIAWHFYITLVAGVTLTIGLLTRVSAAILSASIAYVLLVERQIYVNHYYLLSCLAGLMVFLPAGRRLSIDSMVGIERRSDFFQRWQLWLLRFQVGIPYAFGGIAKLNSDWLLGQPAGIYLEPRPDRSWIAELYLQLPAPTLLFSWGGLVYDLMIVPMLLYRKTRWLGVLMSLVFHFSNSQLFNIGVFPWFMLAGVIVFFPEDSVAKVGKYLRSVQYRFFNERTKTQLKKQDENQSGAEENEKATQAEASNHLHQEGRLAKAGFYLAVAYVVLQTLLPFRHKVLPGNPAWNERGQRFAWRMMLRHKTVLTTFQVVTPNGQYQYFPSTHFLTPTQEEHGERNPELLRQTAVVIKKHAAEVGYKDAKIYCLCLASLNGRRPVPLVNPNVDLSQVKRGWLYDSWVMQNHGPLRKEIWNQDKRLWWQQLDLPERFKPLEGHLPSDLDALINAQKKTQPSALEMP